jgi:hypothetical protein
MKVVNCWFGFCIIGGSVESFPANYALISGCWLSAAGGGGGGGGSAIAYGFIFPVSFKYSSCISLYYRRILSSSSFSYNIRFRFASSFS